MLDSHLFATTKNLADSLSIKCGTHEIEQVETYANDLYG